MNEEVERTVYLGAECAHCGSRSTVVDVLAFRVEGKCLMCARIVDVPDEVQLYWRRKRSP